MSPRAIATIDVGTNTTLLLVARPRAGAGAGAGAGADTGAGAGGPARRADPEVLAEGAEITRLGRGIGGDGRLGREGIERTLAVLRRYAAISLTHDAAVAAVGTEALRRAPNAADFLEPARSALGVPVEVIGGDREAMLTFRAVAESFPDEVAAGRVAVVDIGGGSTEIVVSQGGQIAFRRSLPLGSVRLTERHVRSDPPRPEELAAVEREVEDALDGVVPALAPAHGPFATLVGVAGTVTSLAAMALALDTYDPARVHGSSLGRATLDAEIARLAGMTQAEREHIRGLDPRRADVILAGALLLRAILRRTGVDAVRVSDRGIRWGLYFERAAELDDALGAGGLPPAGVEDSFRS